MGEILTDRDELRGISEHAYQRLTDTLTRLESALAEISAEIERLAARQQADRARLESIAAEAGIALG